MKKNVYLILSIILFAQALIAQVPGKFNYQAVIRNDAGELITEQNVDVQISILNNSPGGTLLYQESHSQSTNAYGIINIVIGDGIDKTADFSEINWSQNDKYLKVEVDAGTGLTNLGTVQLLSVPYSLFAETADSSGISATTLMADIANFADSARVAGMAYTANMANVLGSNSVYSTNTDTLFVVKDHSGNVVFAVFPDGAQIIVNEAAKGKVGGFAVSGRSPAKAADVEILKVTADSTRIFINDTVVAKGSVGGFAVSGRSPSKNSNNNLLFITADSTRVYVNESTGTKGKVGGFAVSGRSPAKGTTQPMFFTTIDSTRIFTNDTISGFGIRDNSKGEATSYMQLTPLNYFIGHRAGESITTGRYNTFIGYETGSKSTWGNGNMFIGFNAGYSNLDGQLNIFIGNEVGYSFTGINDGEENIFIGNNAGKNCITTANSIFIGTRSGFNCGESYGNTFIGDRTASFGAAGDNNTLIGSAAGFNITGAENVFLGAYSGLVNSTGNTNTYVGYYAGMHSTGSRNVFLGAYAGDNELGDDKLYIANNNTSTLIYGDFNTKRVVINGVAADNPGGYTFYANGTAGGDAAWINTSDLRLKRNVETINGALDKILKLRGVSFDWKDPEKKGRQIGFIAQEAKEIIPEVVLGSEETEYSMQYAPITAVLVEAMKEQQTQIEELKAENELLKQKLNEIIELLGNK